MQCIVVGSKVFSQIAGMCYVQGVLLQAQFGGKHGGMVEIRALVVGATHPVPGHQYSLIVCQFVVVSARLDMGIIVIYAFGASLPFFYAWMVCVATQQ